MLIFRNIKPVYILQLHKQSPIPSPQDFADAGVITGYIIQFILIIMTLHSYDLHTINTFLQESD